MIYDLLKWTLYALYVLLTVSALMVVYGLYGRYLSDCDAACKLGLGYNAFLEIGVIGLAGFGISAIAAHVIRDRI